MYNNYTTNNFNLKGNSISTKLIQYEKPKWIVLGAGIYAMHAMILAVTSYRNDEGHEEIRTHHIPLTGEELEPWEPKEMDDKLVILPDNKQLDATTFSKYIEHIKDECSISEGIEELINNDFVPAVKEDIEIKVMACGKTVIVHSPWFRLNLEKKNGGDYLWPSDVSNLCWLAGYLRRPFWFVAHTPDEEQDKVVAEELGKLLEAYEKHGFYGVKGKSVENDGVYTYSKDFGRIAMTRSEFLGKFQGDAEPFNE